MSTKWQHGYAAGKTRARREVAYIYTGLMLGYMAWQLIP